MSHREDPHLTAAPDPDVELYRAVSPLAVFGLLLGLLSATALLSALLWLVPVAGVAISLLALWRIAQEAPALIGRKAAVVGLVLSVFFGLAAPAEFLMQRRMLRGEARQFAQYWFEFLRDRQPHKALELEEAPETRRALDDSLWQWYPAESELRTKLEKSVERQPIRTLLDLGDRAEVRYYGTERHWTDDAAQIVSQLYAVTYKAKDGPTTFFVRLVMKRSVPRSSKQAYWQVMRSEGGVRPESFAGQ